MKLVVVVVVVPSYIWVTIWFSTLSAAALNDDAISSMSGPISSPWNQQPMPPILKPPPAAAAPAPAERMKEEEEAGAGAQVKSGNQHHLNKTMLIALILVSSALCAFLSSLICFWIYHALKKKKNPQHLDFETTTHTSSSSDAACRGGAFLGKINSIKLITTRKGGALPISMIEYPLLEAATNNFAENNILGRGGFGCVYKACFDNNFLAAVKRMDGGGGGGQDGEREFKNEVDLLSKIRHPNIISVLGFCIHATTRFIIYELMQNGSLESQLHGSSHGSALTWHIRMKIALDAARGLEYLHENCNPPVIHRDLKSSNILLDNSFNAKLSDFGLAVISGTQYKNNIRLSGTLGYVAPEYLLDGKLTDKSDVYAFGVILLELLMGRKPVEKMTPSQCQSIVTWAMPQLTDRSKLPTIVDPVIRNTMNLKHLYQVAAVAVLCVQPEPSYRPLITDVLHSLVPLVPVELGGTLRVTESAPVAGP